VAPDAITGWLVPAGDADALAARLADALALPPAARRELGQRARRHVLGTYTVEAMQRRTLAVYDRLLGTGLERRFLERIAHRIPAATPRQT
jgi:glycosyltransferase involved in cell wall biosynthesis